MMTPSTNNAVKRSDPAYTRSLPLRRLNIVCAGQFIMALVMGAVGTVDSDTVIPACYFAVLTAVIGRILSEKPNQG